MRRRPALILTLLLATLGAACGGDNDGIIDPPPTAQPFMGCTTVATIALGSTVTGSLTTADCRFPDNTFVDFYELQLTSARTVTITMSSSAFDTYLVVFDRAGAYVDDDDDSGGGTNSRLVLNLQAGTYIIAANAFDVNMTGTYQLSVN